MSDDVTAFRLRSDMPGEDVDLLEDREAGYLDATIAGVRADIYARLRKRYDVTFADGEPEIVKRWIAKITTPDAYRKRGTNPGDASIALLEADRTRAYDQIKEAADSATGLYDLPLLAESSASGISRGGPLGYSEQSPYTWTDRQAEDGVTEDGR